jgi:DNA-binding transcriptional regulator GbsR (MarR family)
MPTVEDIRGRMIEGGGRTAQTFGLNRVLGQIYMLLYTSERPRSLDEIAEDLRLSKASVSIACRQLGGLGVLRRVWIKGDRKDYYEAETDLRRLLDASLLQSLGRSLESARQLLRECQDGLQEGGRGEERGVAVLRARLREAQRYCDRLASLLRNPILRRLL